MKIHSAHLQFCLCLAACLPLTSRAEMDVPHWINPKWLVAKVMDFHTKNSERFEQTQVIAQTKSTSSASPTSPASPVTANVAPNTVTNVVASKDPSPRKINLAPVENATAKVNEKYLSKEELMELRKQLRQKQ